MDDLERLKKLSGQPLTEGAGMPEPLTIADNVRIVPKHNPFGTREVWWTIQIMSPKGMWVDIQSGTCDSGMFWDLGVRHELAKRQP